MHGFLYLKSADGKIIAIGDQTNITTGNTVKSHLIFRFADGSLDDEVTTFRQGRVFQLLSDHHVQKGPSFPQPLDVTLDTTTGQVTTCAVKGGKTEVRSNHVDLPADLANGIVSAVLENFPDELNELKVSYLIADPKPRIVKLVIKPTGTDTFHVGGASRTALIFNVHIEIGGVAGVVAPVIGKQPDDVRVWVLKGDVPVFLKLEGALYQKGPIWTMELASPAWPK